MLRHLKRVNVRTASLSVGVLAALSLVVFGAAKIGQAFQIAPISFSYAVEVAIQLGRGDVLPATSSWSSVRDNGWTEWASTNHSNPQYGYISVSTTPNAHDKDVRFCIQAANLYKADGSSIGMDISSAMRPGAGTAVGTHAWGNHPQYGALTMRVGEPRCTLWASQHQGITEAGVGMIGESMSGWASDDNFTNLGTQETGADFLRVSVETRTMSGGKTLEGVMIGLQAVDRTTGSNPSCPSENMTRGATNSAPYSQGTVSSGFAYTGLFGSQPGPSDTPARAFTSNTSSPDCYKLWLTTSISSKPRFALLSQDPYGDTYQDLYTPIQIGVDLSGSMAPMYHEALTGQSGEWSTWSYGQIADSTTAGIVVRMGSDPSDIRFCIQTADGSVSGSNSVPTESTIGEAKCTLWASELRNYGSTATDRWSDWAQNAGPITSTNAPANKGSDFVRVKVDTRPLPPNLKITGIRFGLEGAMAKPPAGAAANSLPQYCPANQTPTAIRSSGSYYTMSGVISPLMVPTLGLTYFDAPPNSNPSSWAVFSSQTTGNGGTNVSPDCYRVFLDAQFSEIGSDASALTVGLQTETAVPYTRTGYAYASSYTYDAYFQEPFSFISSLRNNLVWTKITGKFFDLGRTNLTTLATNRHNTHVSWQNQSTVIHGARVYAHMPSNFPTNVDVRFCLQNTQECTPWASSGAGATGWVGGFNGAQLGMETRSAPSGYSTFNRMRLGMQASNTCVGTQGGEIVFTPWVSRTENGGYSPVADLDGANPTCYRLIFEVDPAFDMYAQLAQQPTPPIHLFLNLWDNSNRQVQVTHRAHNVPSPWAALKSTQNSNKTWNYVKPDQMGLSIWPDTLPTREDIRVCVQASGLVGEVVVEGVPRLRTDAEADQAGQGGRRGAVRCTPWASDGGGWSILWATAGGTTAEMTDPKFWRAWVETRAMPAGKIITDIKFGLQLADGANTNAANHCTSHVGGAVYDKWSRSYSTWATWSTGPISVADSNNAAFDCVKPYIAVKTADLPMPFAKLTANDQEASEVQITVGESVTLKWSSLGMASCSGSASQGGGNFSTGGAKQNSNGVTLTPPVGTYTYTLSCTPSQGAVAGSWAQYGSNTVNWGGQQTTCPSSTPQGASCSPGGATCMVATRLNQQAVRIDNYQCIGGSTSQVTVNVMESNELVPDLVVYPSYFYYDNYDRIEWDNEGNWAIPVGGTALFRGSVYNQGIEYAYAPLRTTVQICSGDPNQYDCMYRNEPVSSSLIHEDGSMYGIYSGEGYDVELQKAFYEAGTYYYRFCVDDSYYGENYVYEGIEGGEDNNCSEWSEFKVAPPIRPDLVVYPSYFYYDNHDRFLWDDEGNWSIPEGGATIFRGTVYNQGNAGAYSSGIPTAVHICRDDPNSYNCVYHNNPDYFSFTYYGDSLEAGQEYQFEIEENMSEAGTYFYRMCADDDGNWNTYVDEGVEGENNNCSDWNGFVVGEPGPQPCVPGQPGCEPPAECPVFEATPNPYTEGEQVTLSWECQPATQCTIYDNQDQQVASGGGQGSAQVTPSGEMGYTLSCNNSGYGHGGGNLELKPKASLTFSIRPFIVPEGRTTTFVWKASGVQPGSCRAEADYGTYSVQIDNSERTEGETESYSIERRANWTLICTDLAGQEVRSDSAEVRLVPGFSEF